MLQKNLRRDLSHPDGLARTVVGVSVASSCQAVRAAVVDTFGRGLQTRAEIRGVISLSMADTLATRLRKLIAGGKNDLPIDTFVQVRAELAEVQVEAIERVVAEAAAAPSTILVAGIDEPGVWHTTGSHPAYVSLCDAARVAEVAGVNVVDGFPSRDLAQGGQGGPLGALPQWILLRHARENRLLVDLGRTTRMTFLPADAVPTAATRIVSFDVGPGTWLLDELASRLTGGRHRFDPGGRLAVQGRRLDALVDHWLADNTFNRTLPHWHPRGVRPERFLNEAVQMALESNWSIQDILCTATHLIAEAVAQAARRRRPDETPIDRLLITGGGQHNGMLLAEISARLPGVALSKIGELGVADDALGPASAALLGLFHLDQVPGNLTSVTGAAVSRVLGRLTPGSPQSWQRLLHHMAGGETTPRPLRSAL